MYVIRKMPDIIPAPFDGEFIPERMPAEWAALNEAKIELFPWDESGYKPDARARVGLNEAGLQVLMYAGEATIQAKETRIGGSVYLDSCLEFFILPVAGDDRYLNFEINPIATYHLGVGADRYDRRVFKEPVPGINPRASEHKGGWWAVNYTLPIELIRSIYGRGISNDMRGNFYCCDSSLHQHFGTYYPMSGPKPDFHNPKLFGAITVER